eukprot:jgi/Tetstr1/460312/TSEL_005612.t1
MAMCSVAINNTRSCTLILLDTAADSTTPASMEEFLSSKINWPGVGKFNSVQGILDRNKVLLSEINANHESKTSEGLDRNFHLIQELNSNLAKIVELYRELSTSFITLTEDNVSKGAEQKAQ